MCVNMSTTYLYDGLNVQSNIKCNKMYAFYSPDMPENEATFAITGGGITDAKD